MTRQNRIIRRARLALDRGRVEDARTLMALSGEVRTIRETGFFVIHEPPRA